MQGQNTSTRAGALFVDTVTDPENYFFHILHFDGSVSQELSDTYTGLWLATIKVQQCFLLRWGGLQVTKASWEPQNSACYYFLFRVEMYR